MNAKVASDLLYSGNSIPPQTHLEKVGQVFLFEFEWGWIEFIEYGKSNLDVLVSLARRLNIT